MEGLHVTFNGLPTHKGSKSPLLIGDWCAATSMRCTAEKEKVGLKGTKGGSFPLEGSLQKEWKVQTIGKEGLRTISVGE